MSETIEQRIVEEQRTATCTVCGTDFEYIAEGLVYLVGDNPRPLWKPKRTVCSEQCADDRETQRAAEAQVDAERERKRQANRLQQMVREIDEHRIWPRYRTNLELVDEVVQLPVDASVILSGPTGTGKTYQAWAMWRRWAIAFAQANHCIPEAHFYTAPDLLERLRRSFDGEPVRLSTNSMLVIDDLGVERPTEWVMEQLYRLIDERYRMRAPLIVTTNLNGRELRARLGDRLVSRLAEMCHAVRIEGKDRRLEVTR